MNTFRITPIEDSVIVGTANFPTPKDRLLRILNSGFDIAYNDASWKYKTLRAQLTKTCSAIRKDVLPIVYSRDKKVKEMSNI